MTAVFYISGHGFGHASRQIEIIRALAPRHPDLRIIIRSAVSRGLLERTLRVPHELRPGPCDTGIIQPSSIRQDDEATVREAVRFYERYPEAIAHEVRDLDADAVTLVVSDIAPIAFEVAARLGVPGVAIANFTWDWIYETHPGLVEAVPWLRPRLAASYRKATLALALPFSGGFDVFPTVRPLPLVARRASRSRADTRAFFGLDAHRPTALLSFGGYGLPDLDLGRIDCLSEWAIVTTDRLQSPAAVLPAGVRLIDEEAFRSGDVRYEDLVGAVDVVITKPGYGIIAECISTRTAMLYTSRGVFREYDVLTSAMPRYVRCRFIAPDDLVGGRWLAPLNALHHQSAAPDCLPIDGADHAARVLSGLLAAAR
jgi:UDP:flavonoid glycosyltransferase YjiC (YdhE family)